MINVPSKKNTSQKKPKKEEKYFLVNAGKLKKVEFIVALVLGIVFLVFLFLAMTNDIYIPASLIMLALFFFSICYYYLEEQQNKKMVYILFGLGVLLIIIEVIYTLVKIS